MIRTQIQLSDEQSRELRRIASDKGLSIAEVIRRFVNLGLRQQGLARSDRYAKAARLIGQFPDQQRVDNLGADHDRYLDEAFE
jgi:hypothetical protein